MLLDLSPLKVSRDYRLLFFGQLISFFGSMMSFIVVPWQMYQLTESNAMVGYISIAEFVPMFTLAFVGGALADYLDKRKMLRYTEIGQTLVTLILLINSLAATAAYLGAVCCRCSPRGARRAAAACVRVLYSKSNSVRDDVGCYGAELDTFQYRDDHRSGDRGRHCNAVYTVVGVFYRSSDVCSVAVRSVFDQVRSTARECGAAELCGRR